MAEMVKKATRESFGEALTALAETNPDIVVLDADLAEATKTGIFKKKYPERFIDCGIAECNMIGIAAGLATCGKVPFAASFAMFSAGRAFEQVRNSVGYPHLNVKDRWLPRGHLRGGGRRHPPVLRGHRPDALHPRHGGAQPCRPL